MSDMQNTKAHFQDLSFGQVESGVLMKKNISTY